jgi:hypothetical protein
VPTPIVALIDEERSKNIMEKILESSVYYEKLKKKAQIASFELIKAIEKNCSQFMEK